MLARITFSEFRDRLNESDVARGCFSYDAKQLIYSHLNEDENYIMQSPCDIACEWAESTYEDLKNDWDYDESFCQIYKDVQQWCDGETTESQYNSSIIARVADWLSEKTIYLGVANRGEDDELNNYNSDLQTTTFIYAKNF
tara:strand:- start:503 stop:925 length:423 start_codon:yes stop_codon:yes gene_type:complete